jgi:hypothetical protein
MLATTGASMRTFLPIALLLALACAGPDGAKDDTAASGDTLTVTGPDNVTMNDTEDGLDITIDGGVATGWLFGAVRDGHEAEACVDPEECHVLDVGGGHLDWQYDCEEPDDGSTCLAQLYYRASLLTYVVRPEVGTDCWTWGADTSYYTDTLGCAVTDWEPNSY